MGSGGDEPPWLPVEIAAASRPDAAPPLVNTPAPDPNLYATISLTPFSPLLSLAHTPPLSHHGGHEGDR